MRDRNIKLQEVLESICKNVYFTPPENYRMKYPAIRYSMNNVDIKHADNSTYSMHYRYQLIVMDYDPDSEIVPKILQLPMCSFENHYVKDGLNHWVMNLYY